MDGVVGGVLQARVAAPPAEGAANAALCRLLAAELGVARGAVRIVGGTTARRKIVEVDGLRPADLLARWPDLTAIIPGLAPVHAGAGRATRPGWTGD